MFRNTALYVVVVVVVDSKDYNSISFSYIENSCLYFYKSFINITSLDRKSVQSPLR